MGNGLKRTVDSVPLQFVPWRKKFSKLRSLITTMWQISCHVNANHQVLFLLAQFFKRSQRWSGWWWSGTWSPEATQTSTPLLSPPMSVVPRSAYISFVSAFLLSFQYQTIVIGIVFFVLPFQLSLQYKTVVIVIVLFVSTIPAVFDNCHWHCFLCLCNSFCLFNIRQLSLALFSLPLLFQLWLSNQLAIYLFEAAVLSELICPGT